MSRWLQILIELFFPERCLFCDQVVTHGSYCCKECMMNIPFVAVQSCDKCSKPLEQCICKKQNLVFTSCISSAYYTKSFSKGIHHYKYNGQKQYAPFFADLVAKTILSRYNGLRFDVITEVPMHSSKLKQRGYNQSELIAKHIARTLHIPHNSIILQNTGKGTSQQKLGAKERRFNAECSFCMGKEYRVKDKTILLIDDVMTTGNTLNACSKILLENGARAIYCATITTTIKGCDIDVY